MKRRRIISVLTVILVFIGLLLVKVSEWVPNTFGNIPFEQVLFHLMVPMEGTDTTFVASFIEYCLPLPCIVSAILLLCCIIKDWKVSRDIRDGEFQHVRNNVLIIITSLSCLFVYVFGINDVIHAVGIDEYWNNVKHPSTLYENFYVEELLKNREFLNLQNLLIII